MSSRIVYIKIPVVMELQNPTEARKAIINKFGKDIFTELDYREELSTDDIIKTMIDRHEIIEKLNEK